MSPLLAVLRARLQRAVGAPTVVYEYEGSQRFAAGLAAGLRIAVAMLDGVVEEEEVASSVGVKP